MRVFAGWVWGGGRVFLWDLAWCWVFALMGRVYFYFPHDGLLSVSSVELLRVG